MEEGYTFWNSKHKGNCNFHRYSVLYEGYANNIDDLIYNHVQTVYSFSLVIFETIEGEYLFIFIYNIYLYLFIIFIYIKNQYKEP